METAEQLRELQAAGRDFVEGYLIARHRGGQAAADGPSGDPTSESHPADGERDA